ncbi:hypothetical protein ASD98_00270 [Flavobacterium sp. Root186]|nr:hypothetical protein ASD98_00270 [Flavobacterium sp. Root186]
MNALSITHNSKFITQNLISLFVYFFLRCRLVVESAGGKKIMDSIIYYKTSLYLKGWLLLFFLPQIKGLKGFFLLPRITRIFTNYFFDSCV